ncbi:uncharacterized protein V1513DRAFT_443492 [Lipomyces chichibuensis]|uniref:uncharacterized protein n=1 Tax=Lipomyces chichibuensis TaxID=1546026 RepID=UPI003343BF73
MSLESALEEERLEILKLLDAKKPKAPEPLALPARTSRSASPMRSRDSRSPSEGRGGSVGGPSLTGGMITPSSLVKNFHNLSPAAQELLLSSTSVPELIRGSNPPSSSDRQRRPSTGSMPSSSMLLPSAGPELPPYPTLGSGSSSMLLPNSAAAQHHRASSFGSYSDGGSLRRYKSADDEQAVRAFMSQLQSQPQSSAVLGSPTQSPQISGGGPMSPAVSASSRSRSPASTRRPSLPQQPEEDFSNAYRRLSNAALLKSGGKLAALASKRSPSSDSRLEKDEEDEGAIESSSSSEEDDANSDESDIEEQVSKLEKTSNTRQPQSLLAAMEEERKAVATAKKYSVQSLIAPPPPSHIDGAASYKRHLIHPKTAFDLVEDATSSFNSPYTSDNEEAIDIQKAVNLPIKVSDIEANSDAGRVLRTITRGDYETISKDPMLKKRSYIVATDSSAESMYALEWTIGTILRDGNLMYAVFAIEEPEDTTTPTADESAAASALEKERITAAKEITSVIVKLLKKTRLQVECVVEVMHCKSPKHLLCDVIDYLSPTMVILGSRGRSALKGVLLGSFSNYLVTKSSVPVMVARKKLKKSKHHRGAMPKFSNNLREGVTSLSLAKVD